MAKTGTLTVRIVGDTKSFNNALDSANGRLGKFGEDFKRIGKQLAAAGAAAAVAFTKSAVDMASALEQSVGAIETVFGPAKGAIEAFSATAAKEFGLSTRSVNEMSSRIGASLQGLGFSLTESADLTVQLQQRGADLAATFGGPVEDAVAAVGSLLRGERDPIERYGVAIKQADINARLAAEGLDGLTGEAKKQAEAQAALTLLFEQTASSAGAFGRESNTLAGQQERLKAQFENLSAEIGTKLLPHLVKLAEWAGENLPAAFEFAERWIGRFVGAVQAAARWAADFSIAAENFLQPAIDNLPIAADIFRGFWNGMVSMATGAINAIIGGIELMLQGIRNGTQGLRNLVDAVPGVNLPDVPNVNLPRVGGGSTTNVTVNMPPGSDGDDVAKKLRDFERANGPLEKFV